MIKTPKKEVFMYCDKCGSFVEEMSDFAQSVVPSCRLA